MHDDPDRQQLFTEKEISLILKRSAEIQAETDTIDSTGLSLEELKQIAGEVGINPSHIETALAEIRSGKSESVSFHVLGGPTSARLERVVEGEISPDQWEDVATEIRQSFRAVGTTGQVGQSLEWTRTSRHMQNQVAVTSKNGRTKIRIVSSFGGMMSYFMPVVIPSLIVAFVVIPLVLPAAIAVKGALSLGIVALLYMLIRLAFGTLSQKQAHKARDLMTRLEKIVATPSAGSAQQIEQTQSETRMDLSQTEQDREGDQTPSRITDRKKRTR